MGGPTASVADYLEGLEPTRAAAVRRVCEAIIRDSPGARETMAHGMPFYTLDGRPYIAVASQKRHVSVYVVGLAETLAADPALAASFDGLDRGKTCLRYADRQLDRITAAALAPLVAATYRACRAG